jgi:hypothetical protein
MVTLAAPSESGTCQKSRGICRRAPVRRDSHDIAQTHIHRHGRPRRAGNSRTCHRRNVSGFGQRIEETAALSLMMRFITAIPPSNVRPRDFVDLSTRESRDPHPRSSRAGFMARPDHSPKAINTRARSGLPPLTPPYQQPCATRLFRLAPVEFGHPAELRIATG